MTFQALCKSIESRAAGKLVSAKSQAEKELILTATLYEYDRVVLKYLYTLAQQEGADSTDYIEAQNSAVELLTFLALPFISSCSSYKQAITILEELTAACSDEVISRRLTVYANQIKRRWNDADPSALPINPRGAKVRQKKQPSTVIGGKWLFLLLPVVLYLLLDSSLSPFGNMNQAQLPQVEEVTRVIPDMQEDRQLSPAPVTSTPRDTSPDGDYFSYTDKQGVLHLGNRLAKGSENMSNGATGEVPPAQGGNFTPVLIRGNQVLVPVTLSYRSRSVNATLLLDTGATVTTINERLARSLGVDLADTKSATSRVADGRTIRSWAFVADSIAVGPRRLHLLQTSILPGSGGAGHDGLLGMDFLRDVRYHVDFNRNVIEWGG
jgi:clan AA aspartic protease (TIGR02281 family)